MGEEGRAVFHTAAPTNASSLTGPRLDRDLIPSCPRPPPTTIATYLGSAASATAAASCPCRCRCRPNAHTMFAILQWTDEVGSLSEVSSDFVAQQANPATPEAPAFLLPRGAELSAPQQRDRGVAGCEEQRPVGGAASRRQAVHHRRQVLRVELAEPRKRR